MVRDKVLLRRNSPLLSAPAPAVQWLGDVRATVERTRRALEMLGFLFISRGPIKTMSSTSYNLPNIDEFRSHLLSQVGPGAIENHLRQAFLLCWIMLPPERRLPDEVASSVRSIFERVSKSWSEDASRFFVSAITAPLPTEPARPDAPNV